MIEITVDRNGNQASLILPFEVEEKLLKAVKEDFAPLSEIIKTAICIYAERR